MCVIQSQNICHGVYIQYIHDVNILVHTFYLPSVSVYKCVLLWVSLCVCVSDDVLVVRSYVLVMYDVKGLLLKCDAMACAVDQIDFCPLVPEFV